MACPGVVSSQGDPTEVQTSPTERLGRQGGRWFSQKMEELEDPRQGKHLGRNRKDGINGSFLQPSEHRKRSKRDPRDKPGMTADWQED